MSRIKNKDKPTENKVRTGRARTVAALAMASALALILSYLESLVPLSVAVPGVKAGLANIVILFMLYRVGLKEAAAVSGVRLLWVAILFGSFLTFLYSLAGAVLSLCVMAPMKKSGLFSAVGVSVTGGVMHNVGQIIVAVLVMGTAQIAYYMPVLMISGVVSGVLVGVVSAILIKKIPKSII